MDTIRKTIYDIDLSKQLQRIFSGVLLAKNDKQANRMGVNVYQDGQAVSLSGYTVKGYFIRSGVETLILNGAIDGNTAYVDLDAKCYHKDGSFSLSVVLCRDGREQTLVIFDGRIACTCTDTVVENENTLSLDDIVQQEWVTNVLNAADTAMEQAGKAAASAVEAQNILDTAAAEAQAIVDSIPPDYTEAVKKLDEKAPAIFVDASGDLVHITDGADMPVKSLITHIEPVQEGSGDPSPDNVRPIRGWDSVEAKRTGKNLIPAKYKTAFGTKNGITFTDLGDGKIGVNGTATDAVSFHMVLYTAGNRMLLRAGTYTFGTNTHEKIVLALYVYTTNDNNATNNQVINCTKSKPTVTFTLDTDCYVGIYFYVRAGDTVENTVVYPQLELSSAATAYEPYQGQTLTADLPETVYGGTLDWGTGVLTVDMVKLTGFSGFGGVVFGLNGKGIPYLDMRIISAPVIDGGVFCNSYKIVRAYTNGDAASGNVRVYKTAITVYDERFTDAENAKQLLQDEGFELVYKIIAPYTIQLTPRQLSTLKGINNVWSDAGETEVTYAADSKMYIDNLVTALVNGQKEE